MTDSSQRYSFQSALLEHVHEGMIACGPDGRIVAANAPARAILALGDGYLIGRDAADPAWGFLRSDGTTLLPEEHPVHRAMADRRPVVDALVGIRKGHGGEVAWATMSAFPDLLPDGGIHSVVVKIAGSQPPVPTADGPFQSDRGIAAMFLASPIAIAAIRLSDEVLVDANDAFLSAVGCTRNEAVGRHTSFLEPWLDPSERARLTRELEKFGRVSSTELEYRLDSGEEGAALVWLELVEFSGELCALCFLTDISEQKRVEGALRESEERYRLVSENIADVIWLLDPATGRFIYVSPSVERLRGYTVEEVMTQSFWEVVTPESLAAIEGLLPARVAAFEAGDESARIQTNEIVQTRKDGTMVPTEVITTFIPDVKGKVRLVQGVSRDITARKQVEEELRVREARLEETGRIAKIGGFRFDALTGKGFWSDEVARIHEVDPHESISRERGIDFYVGESKALISAAVSEAVEHAVPYDLELEIETAKGNRKWVRTLGRPVLEDGRVVSVVGSLQDISDRRQAEDSLRQSEARFRTLIDGAPDGVFVHVGYRVEYANRALARMLGATPEELVGQDFWQFIAREYWDTVRSRVAQTDLNAGPVSPLEEEYTRLDGSRVPVEITAIALEDDPERRHMVFVRDMTERKRAEADRESLRRQLQQSQKMESVGQLAGGIAHDFNNILMVQRGYCEMMKTALRPGDPFAEDLAQIEACTQRATALTAQLLAFSRKQTLQPRLLDLNSLVTNLAAMLHRLIGEDIELRTVLAPQPARVSADPGQLEQVLVNLAVNARDAMAGGGTLTVAISHLDLEAQEGEGEDDLAPGRYVRLRVSDTGRGMSDDVKSRVFEPFFTTKPEGKGTGLGLSTVHGIVHQSGGYVGVASKVGHGSAFTILLPAVERPVMERPVMEPAAKQGRGQLILVVEDEPALRRLAVTMLEKLGYQTVGAENGGAALMLVEEEGLRPDLVVTDVVMPGMRGGVLVERLRKTMPDVSVIYMSGYTDDAIVNEQAGVSAQFLQKPFSMASLTAAIDAALVSA
jgi:two-component system, cell cycle sensor histidine kinase and response regulator CckA